MTDKKIVISAASKFVRDSIKAEFIIQTEKQSLLEIYKMNIRGVNDTVKFLIFFPPQSEEDIPDWYPSTKLSHDTVYLVINDKPSDVRDLVCMTGADPIKGLVMKYASEFV